jgi:hypothetical protein
MGFEWAFTSSMQAFSSWVHLIAIRMFVESILRYGLPPAYQAAVLIPVEKAEPRLRAALNDAFSGGEVAQSQPEAPWHKLETMRQRLATSLHMQATRFIQRTSDWFSCVMH